MHCLYHVTSLSTWRHCKLDQRVIDMQSDSGAPVCARVSRWKAVTLFSKWQPFTFSLSAFQPFTEQPVVLDRGLQDTSICFSERLQRQLQRLLLIFVAVFVTELIFVQQCFYTVCAASYLKRVVVDFASSDQKLYHNNLGVPVIITHRVYRTTHVVNFVHFATLYWHIYCSVVRHYYIDQCARCRSMWRKRQTPPVQLQAKDVVVISVYIFAKHQKSWIRGAGNRVTRRQSRPEETYFSWRLNISYNTAWSGIRSLHSRQWCNLFIS